METAREIVKERFFREGFTYIFATINKDFWWLKQKKKVRKSSAKTDKNVHNLKKKKKIPAQTSWLCILFYYYIYERNILGSIHKATGGSHVASSTLLGNLIHDERELGPQSGLLLFCLRLWFDMTVGIVTVLHMFPPLWLLQQLIHDNLYSHTVTGIKNGTCRKIIWQKTMYLIVFYPNTNRFITVVHGTPGWEDRKKDWTGLIGN